MDSAWASGFVHWADGGPPKSGKQEAEGQCGEAGEFTWGRWFEGCPGATQGRHLGSVQTSGQRNMMPRLRQTGCKTVTQGRGDSQEASEIFIQQTPRGKPETNPVSSFLNTQHLA